VYISIEERLLARGFVFHRIRAILAGKRMAQYENNSILELKNQLVLTPRKMRLSQLRKAEKLIDTLEQNKVYPYEFICHRITGYRPTENRGVLLQGTAFIRDMVQLVDDVSSSLDLRGVDLEEGFLTKKQLAEKFSVSGRTLLRWRRLGLRSRKITIDSWRRKTVYPASAVKSFEKRNTRLIRKARAFSQLSAREKEEIVRIAQRINRSGKLRISEVAGMVAEKLGRSREAVRYTLRRHDRLSGDAIFDDGSVLTKEERQRRVLECCRKGRPVRQIAEEVKRHRATVYRIIYQKKAEEILARNYEYVYEAAFDAPDAEKIILGDALPLKESRARIVLGKARPQERVEPEELLSRQEEYDLFRKYNFYKYKICRLRKRLEQGDVKGAVVRRIESLHRKAIGIKKKLTSANLALVGSIAKRHLGYYTDFQDLISEGNIKLMHAIEKFDYTRGIRFSTYASWAVIKHYAKVIPAQNFRSQKFITGSRALIENIPQKSQVDNEDVQILSSLKESIRGILGGLSEKERYIIVHRFGLEEEGKVQTLEEIGKVFGLSRERIRQVEKKTLEKLKGLIDSEAAREALA